MAIQIKGQLLFYPMKNTTISGGYLNFAYAKHYSYTHYGIDCVELTAKSFDVLSCGNGVVLGTEFNSGNSLGNIVVAKYPNVYIPSLNINKDLIIRYYHMTTCNIKKGDNITKGQKIGYVQYGHKWWNHIHIEIDTDTKHPFHTPQVSEYSSNLLIRNGANGNTFLNPIDVLVIGKEQTAIVHPNATLADKIKDMPKYKESDFILETNESYQKLIQPINNMRVTAGYKNTKYESLVVNGLRMGRHYGIDCGGSTIIYGSGNGIVLQAGLDSILGNVVIVKYEKCWNHKLNKIVDVVLKYHHLASITVKVRDKVTTNTRLGVMGNTGKYSTGIHLHLEADTDTKYYSYTPTLSGNSSTLKAGYRDSRDTTFNPSEVLHCKISAPDNQSITRTYDGYTSDDDISGVKII